MYVIYTTFITVQAFSDALSGYSFIGNICICKHGTSISYDIGISVFEDLLSCF